MFAFHCGTPRFKFGPSDLCELEETSLTTRAQMHHGGRGKYFGPTQSKQISPLLVFCVVPLVPGSILRVGPPSLSTACSEALCIFCCSFLFSTCCALRLKEAKTNRKLLWPSVRVAEKLDTEVWGNVIVVIGVWGILRFPISHNMCQHQPIQLAAWSVPWRPLIPRCRGSL